MEKKLTDWFTKVNDTYAQVLEHLNALDDANGKTVMIDIDETILFNTHNPIPGSVEFVNYLSRYFNVVIVTGRIDKDNRRAETEDDLKPYVYHKLILRPVGESHKYFKLRIKNELSPITSIGDQLNDHPDYLVPNPFYYINDEGDEVYLK